jgi:hypothetical protein
MRRMALFGLFVALSASTAAAQESAGRYSFAPVEGGVLRLDTVTGEVTLCSAGAEGASCAPQAGATGHTEGTVEAAQRIAALERRIAALEARGEPETLADDEAIDRVMVLAERMMRQFFGLVREMQHEMETDEL